MDTVEMYARDSGNKIKYWSIEVEQQTSDETFIIIKHGQLGGKLQTKIDPIIEGKNIGKANETTPHQQAISEAESRVELQRKKGYKTLKDLEIHRTKWQDEETKASVYIYAYGSRESFNLELILQEFLPKANTDANDNILVMKCQPYYKDAKRTKVRIKFPCFGQPKINGVRAFAMWKDGKAVIFSKKGLEYPILTHIIEDFKEDDFEYNGIPLIYDGELYIPGSILSDITSAVRTNQLATSAVKFYVFDLAVSNWHQAYRLNVLDELFSKDIASLYNAHSVKLVDSKIIKYDDEAQKLTDQWIKEGYEGGIFRDPEALYGFGKRPMTITKLKRYEEEEFKIVDVIPQTKRPDLALFVCITKEGKRFETNPEGSEELRRKYLTDRDDLIGKQATVQFYEWTVNNIPFHTKLIAIRNYE